MRAGAASAALGERGQRRRGVDPAPAGCSARPQRLGRRVLGDGTGGNAWDARADAAESSSAPGSWYQGRRSSMAARIPVAKQSTVPLGTARIASAARIRSCRIDTDVLLPDSECEVDVVCTAWSPMSRDSLSAKSGSSMPEPITLAVEADHMASIPASPHTFWPWP